MTDIVVGSGPAGVAVALARRARGHRVILLDAGRRPEPEAAARIAAGLDPDDPDARARWMEPQFAVRPGQVRRYGSDFAMEPPEATFELDGAAPAIALRASRAAGGLSNLWGGALLPWTAEDIRGWPIGIEDLAPSWATLARDLVPVAGREDALADLFPGLPMAGRSPLPPGRQLGRALARMQARAPAMAALGARAGLARNAVAPGCRRCGLCLHGCPWGLVWSARQALDHLAADPGLDYRPGATVRAMHETDGGAIAHLGDGTHVEGARLFLATGVLETARILMASPGGPAAMRLSDSQFAFLPALGPRAAPAAALAGRDLHTMVQAFVEIADPAVSPHLVHAQLYGWNEFYARDLRANYGRRLPGAGPALDRLARHLVVAQVFLHSDHSARIHLTPAASGRLVAQVERNEATPAVLDRALARMGAALRLGGLRALTRAARPAPVGASFHVGASLPMSRLPVRGESDRLGRPFGAERLHVVDASVLPAIPATTITFGMMGNAHRIGIEAP